MQINISWTHGNFRGNLHPINILIALVNETLTSSFVVVYSYWILMVSWESWSADFWKPVQQKLYSMNATNLLTHPFFYKHVHHTPNVFLWQCISYAGYVCVCVCVCVCVYVCVCFINYTECQVIMQVTFLGIFQKLSADEDIWHEWIIWEVEHI